MNDQTPDGQTPDGQPVDLIGLIESLADPIPPPPVSLAPQTIGWAVAAALLVVLLAWCLWLWVRRRRANAYRRAALAELASAGDDPAAIARILRRTALAVWPRESVANLYGAEWLRFLDATGGNKGEGGFVSGPGAVLASAPYRRQAGAAPGLHGLAVRWIKRHRAGVEVS
jgi:hypothetical protein